VDPQLVTLLCVAYKVKGEANYKFCECIGKKCDRLSYTK
jgi:hypothetical protein